MSPNCTSQNEKQDDGLRHSLTQLNQQDWTAFGDLSSGPLNDIAGTIFGDSKVGDLNQNIQKMVALVAPLIIGFCEKRGLCAHCLGPVFMALAHRHLFNGIGQSLEEAAGVSFLNLEAGAKNFIMGKPSATKPTTPNIQKDSKHELN